MRTQLPTFISHTPQQAVRAGSMTLISVVKHLSLSLVLFQEGNSSTGSANSCPDHSQAPLQKHLIQAFRSLKILKGRIFTSQEFTMCARELSCGCLFATPWTVALQAPLPMDFSRQEYWSGSTFPPPGYLPHSGIAPASPSWAGRFFTTEPAGKPKS